MRLKWPWLEVEVYADWRRLRALIVCRLVGHAEPNVIGDCSRCHTDLLGLSRSERVHLAMAELNRSTRQRIEFELRSRL